MRVTFILYFTIFGVYSVLGQHVKNIDALSLESYKTLEKTFYDEEYNNPKKARVYADAYLKKARTNGDSIQMARGYKYISFLL